MLGEGNNEKWIVLLLSLFFLTACGTSKGLSEKEAANVFMDAVFYNKQTTLFKENFSDADEIFKIMQENGKNPFTDELITGITQASNISDDEAKMISDSMEKAVK